MLSDKGFVVLSLSILALISCATTERSFEGSERSRSEIALHATGPGQSPDLYLPNVKAFWRVGSDGP